MKRNTFLPYKNVQKCARWYNVDGEKVKKTEEEEKDKFQNSNNFIL